MTPQSAPTPPAWASPLLAGATALATLAAAILIGSAAPLALLALPAGLIGFRLGWRQRDQVVLLTTESMPVPEPSLLAEIDDEPAPVIEDSTPPKRWVDEPALMQRLGGSVEILRDLTALFAEDNIHRLAALRTALDAKDPVQVSREAHGIKSGLTNFCADEAVAVAFHIEKTAKDGSLEGLSAAADVLAITLQEVTDQLNAMGRAA